MFRRGTRAEAYRILERANSIYIKLLLESMEKLAVQHTLADKRDAFCMGSHARLGNASPIASLPDDILYMVLDKVEPV